MRFSFTTCDFLQSSPPDTRTQHRQQDLPCRRGQRSRCQSVAGRCEPLSLGSPNHLLSTLHSTRRFRGQMNKRRNTKSHSDSAPLPWQMNMFLCNLLRQKSSKNGFGQVHLYALKIKHRACTVWELKLKTGWKHWEDYLKESEHDGLSKSNLSTTQKRNGQKKDKPRPRSREVLAPPISISLPTTCIPNKAFYIPRKSVFLKKFVDLKKNTVSRKQKYPEKCFLIKKHHVPLNIVKKKNICITEKSSSTFLVRVGKWGPKIRRGFFFVEMLLFFIVGDPKIYIGSSLVILWSLLESEERRHPGSPTGKNRLSNRVKKE